MRRYPCAPHQARTQEWNGLPRQHPGWHQPHPDQLVLKILQRCAGEALPVHMASISTQSLPQPSAPEDAQPPSCHQGSCLASSEAGMVLWTAADPCCMQCLHLQSLGAKCHLKSTSPMHSWMSSQVRKKSWQKRLHGHQPRANHLVAFVWQQALGTRQLSQSQSDHADKTAHSQTDGVPSVCRLAGQPLCGSVSFPERGSGPPGSSRPSERGRWRALASRWAVSSQRCYP
mmetsp:Transcript_2524/g.4366  ORF Transcript_2524/g.4366 Transcript_2524/m.4366 type:complete len:230 (+) Transcript_2524:645-1334(+)